MLPRPEQRGVIRPYVEADEVGVVALWNVVFPDDPPWNSPPEVIRLKLSVQREFFLVCQADGAVVATVLAGFDGVRGWVHKLAVHPDHQGQGIGTRLMAAAEQGLAALGCPKINLQVRASNSGAADFYLRAGYVVEDRISMGKHLAPQPYAQDSRGVGTAPDADGRPSNRGDAADRKSVTQM
jgi:ribosomal protein S18 acetylase RimI-like enzyme